MPSIIELLNDHRELHDRVRRARRRVSKIWRLATARSWLELDLEVLRAMIELDAIHKYVQTEIAGETEYGID
jgi:hypothetical protein